MLLGPASLYLIKTDAEWMEDTCFWKKAASSASGVTAREYMRLRFGTDCERPEDVPRKKHASIWDFFTAIGFDHKRRRYVDQAGTPVRYSVLPPKAGNKVQRIPRPAAV